LPPPQMKATKDLISGLLTRSSHRTDRSISSDVDSGFGEYG
jgi:hypothetical protein